MSESFETKELVYEIKKLTMDSEETLSQSQQILQIDYMKYYILVYILGNTC